VIESNMLGEIDGLVVWEVRTDSGAYIKELISGDGGRTRPSVAEVLGIPATCVSLDVVGVHWRAPWEEWGTREGGPACPPCGG
jgi:tRNA pseudouridine synthase 10